MPYENPFLAKYYEPVIACLKNARELITKYENWTIIAQARTTETLMCSYEDEDAVQFCAVGACMRAIEETPENVCKPSLRNLCRKRLNDAATKLYGKGTMQLNDEKKTRRKKTHKKILRVYDEAIRELESHQ